MLHGRWHPETLDFVLDGADLHVQPGKVGQAARLEPGSAGLRQSLVTLAEVALRFQLPQAGSGTVDGVEVTLCGEGEHVTQAAGGSR